MFVYADNAATTKIDPAVLKAMMPWLEEGYGNASTLYKKGREAKMAMEEARKQVAKVINADPAEITFTGSGSEADNMALKGVMQGPAAKGRKHLITTKIEHHAVLYTAQSLEKQGFSVTYLDVDSAGRVDPAAVEAAITPDTALVSVMAANNEIGTIEPIAEIGAICKKHGVLFHTDAVQGFCHMPIDVKAMNIDLLSLSAHKINGPKGTGALYKRKGIFLKPVVDGGGQENGLRSGTENIAGIVGLGAAAQLASESMEEENLRLRKLQKKLIAGLLAIPQVILTGDPENRLPGTTSVCISAIEGESLVLYLDMNGICSSTGSACSTGSLDPSHVLMAIGLKHEVAHGSLRLSLGRFTTEEQVDYILETVPKVVNTLRAMSPVWHG
ncbi:cysteine desulfurase NifS [Acidaminobacterium chupaoyuni]